MPNYSYICKKCKRDYTISRSIAQRDDIILCIKCGKGMERVFEAPQVAPSRFPYTHNNLGPEPVVIGSRAQEKSEFAQRGVSDAR